MNFSWHLQRRIKVTPLPPPLQEKNQYDYTCNKNILFKVEKLQEQVNCKNTSYPRRSLDNGLSGRGLGTSWRNESHPLIPPTSLPRANVSGMNLKLQQYFFYTIVHVLCTHSDQQAPSSLDHIVHHRNMDMKGQK